MGLFPVPPGDSPDGSADPKRRSEGSPGHASTSSSTTSPTPYSPGAQPYTYPAPQPPAPYSTAVQQQQGGASQIGTMPAVYMNHLPQQQVEQQQQQQQQQYIPNQRHRTRRAQMRLCTTMVLMRLSRGTNRQSLWLAQCLCRQQTLTSSDLPLLIYFCSIVSTACATLSEDVHAESFLFTYSFV